jgi:hypothetical protein
MTDLREPPTASIRRVDVSGSGARASAAPAGPSRTTEAALFDAYANPAPMAVRRPCVCGGWVHVEMRVPRDWDSIREAVDLHNETNRHADWREREGIA